MKWHGEKRGVPSHFDRTIVALCEQALKADDALRPIVMDYGTRHRTTCGAFLGRDPDTGALVARQCDCGAADVGAAAMDSLLEADDER